MECHDILLAYTPENTLVQGMKLETQKLDVLTLYRKGRISMQELLSAPNNVWTFLQSSDA